MKNELKLVPVAIPEEGVKVGNYYVAGDSDLWDSKLTKGKAYLIEGVFNSEDPENKGRCGMLTLEYEFEIMDDRGVYTYMYVLADARQHDPDAEFEEDSKLGKGCIMEVDEA